MRIAVSYEDGKVFEHFGHTPSFKLYVLSGSTVTDSLILGTGGGGHDVLASFLKALRADVLICGGIGAEARQALTADGIQIYGGVGGGADSAVEAFLQGKLSFDPHASCDHKSCSGNCGDSCRSAAKH